MSDVILSFGKGLDGYLTKDQIKNSTPLVFADTPTNPDGTQNSIYNDDIAMANYYDLGFENWLIEYNNGSSSPYNSHTNVRNTEIFNNWYSTPRTTNYWIEDSIDIVIKIENLKKQVILQQATRIWINKGYYRFRTNQI